VSLRELEHGGVGRWLGIRGRQHQAALAEQVQVAAARSARSTDQRERARGARNGVLGAAHRDVRVHCGRRPLADLGSGHHRRLELRQLRQNAHARAPRIGHQALVERAQR
jgi:hypothetical protein